MRHKEDHSLQEPIVYVTSRDKIKTENYEGGCRAGEVSKGAGITTVSRYQKDK